MKRFCVICGKELDIILGEPIEGGLEIIDGGYLFKCMNENRMLSDIKFVNKQNEYWECEECYNE